MMKSEILTLDFNNFVTGAVDNMRTDLLTSTIILTVGKVVCKFWGWGGRIVTGTTPNVQKYFELKF